MNTLELLNKQEQIKKRIEKTIFGTIEIRTQNEKKYIYVHFRSEGILLSKYVGEYSPELLELIRINNTEVKELKKELKKIQKELGILQYQNFSLTDNVKINIDLAMQNFVNLVYSQSILEGVATTYANTETIIEGGIVDKMTVSDITKIINLKRAWNFILSEGVISQKTSYQILCEINKSIERDLMYSVGMLRTSTVRITGTNYISPMPFETKIKEEITKILNAKPSFDVAIDLMLYVMKTQPFFDGNKRTAVVFANHYLISHGLGLIVVSVKEINKFRNLLIAYYEKKNSAVKEFLKTKCIIELTWCWLDYVLSKDIANIIVILILKEF